MRIQTSRPTVDHGIPADLVDLLPVALAAAERRWAVFPLATGSKRPIVTKWERWATTDPARIRAWWADHPADNVGIACGPSRLLVIDLDAPHGPVPARWQRLGVRHGRDMLAMLAAHAGEPDPLDTLIVATPNDGEHRYYAQPAGLCLRGTVGSRGRGLGWHVDTRGHGAQVVAPGSWLDLGDLLVPYTVVRDRPPAPLPAWLARRLTPPPPQTPRPPAIRPVTSRRISAYVDAAVAGETARVRTAEVSERHIAVYAAAAALGELAENHWITDAAITHHLVEAARRHLGVAGFSWSELTTTISDGIAAGRRNPRDIPDPRPRPPGQPNPTESEANAPPA